jgi:hypothetical protein
MHLSAKRRLVFKSSQWALALCQVMLLNLTLTACTLVSQHGGDEKNLITTLSSAHSQTTKLESIDYGAAVAEAQLAIAKQELQFLAAGNRTISLPGIDLQKNSLQELQQRCGYRFLKGMGDTLHSKEDIQRRKALHRYASAYNQAMLVACLAATH